MIPGVTENVSLKAFNTLAVEAEAEWFAELRDLSQLPELVDFARQNRLPLTVLGGGSNVVLPGTIPGLVIRMATTGISVVTEGDDVLLTVAAGENWHQLVCWSLQQGYFGLENLALIPGSVGAAPVQNIGAYGVELASRLYSVTGLDLETGTYRTLFHAECQFGYRDSLFKRELKGKFIITSVVLRLSLKPEVCVDYPALKAMLEQQGFGHPTPQQVADAVIAVRRSKLPDPQQLPNAGSFFKNPIVSSTQYRALVNEFPELIGYSQSNGQYKLAAGWLVEQAGWKGRSFGEVAVHDRQALVLVNPGSGSGAHILQLAAAIQNDVQQQFGVSLEIEPVIY